MFHVRTGNVLPIIFSIGVDFVNFEYRTVLISMYSFPLPFFGDGPIMFIET